MNEPAADVVEERSISVLWANFDRLVGILPRSVRDQVLSDLACASEPGKLPAFKVAVAQNLIEYLRPVVHRPGSALELLSMPSGTLFEYLGSMGSKGLGGGLGQADEHARGRIRIPSRGRVLVESHPRVDHTLTNSMGTFQDLQASRYLLGVKGPNEANFDCLALGVSSVNWMGDKPEDRYGRLSVSTPESFAKHVVDSFAREVSQRNAWRLLHDRADGSQPSREASVQYLFETCCNLLRGELEVSIDPESDHGAGDLDVCISSGSAATCIELKRASHARLRHGLEAQLPRYMEAKGTANGWFVVVVQEPDLDPAEVEQRLASATIPVGLNISVRVIDARPRESASR